MATKYNDIVTLRSMKPAYNIKYEGPDDWKSFIANDQFNDLLRKTISAVRNNDADIISQFGLQVLMALVKVMQVLS